MNAIGAPGIGQEAGEKLGADVLPWIAVGLPFGAALFGAVYGATRRPLRGEGALENAFAGAGAAFIVASFPAVALSFFAAGGKA